MIWEGDKHIISISHLTVLITNNRKRQLRARNLIDILDPSSMRLDRVGRETNQLDATLSELRLELREGPELGGAHGCVVFGVGEENDPFVADELVEIDGAGGGLCLEVWGDGSETETVVKLLAGWTGRRGIFERYGILGC